MVLLVLEGTPMRPSQYEQIYEIGKKLHAGILRWKTLGSPISGYHNVALLALRVWEPHEHDLFMEFAMEVGAENIQGWVKTIVISVHPELYGPSADEMAEQRRAANEVQ